MEEELAANEDLATCERNVLGRVKAAGLGEVLLDTYGPKLIDELWRERDGHASDNHEPEQVNHVPTPGIRRVDVEQLATRAALLESLFYVDGNWIRLGDLDRRQCGALQRKYESVADAVRAKALAFAKLVDGLDEGQTVRQRWTAKQLKYLVGNTLG